MFSGRYDQFAQDGVFSVGHFGFIVWFDHKQYGPFETRKEAEEFLDERLKSRSTS